MNNLQPLSQKVKNPAHTLWVCQVNANYHSGMTEAEAEAAAGAEPARYIDAPLTSALADALFAQQVPA